MKSQMFLLSILFTVLLVGIRTDVQGQMKDPTGHLKKIDPDEIFVAFSQMGDCPNSLEQVVDSELAQSRIKRKESWEYTELILYVKVNCLLLDNVPSTVYSVDIKFAEFVFPTSKQPDEYSFVLRTYESAYGTFGITSNNDSGTQFLRSVTREALEEALLDYLKVNFDL